MSTATACQRYIQYQQQSVRFSLNFRISHADCALLVKFLHGSRCQNYWGQTSGGSRNCYWEVSSASPSIPSPFPLSSVLLLLFPSNTLGSLLLPCNSPRGRSRQNPAAKRILVHFEMKTKHFRAQISRSFSRQICERTNMCRWRGCIIAYPSGSGTAANADST